MAYVPFCGVVHSRYASSLTRLGMQPVLAEVLVHDPIYRRQNRLLAEVCTTLAVPADATEDLRRAEAQGIPQYWEYDTHPRPAGYADNRSEHTCRAGPNPLTRMSSRLP